jgi:3-dehydroquinate dehydratase-2
MNVIIINGPNLNLLGKREVSIYGNISFDDYMKNLKDKFTSINLSYFQSNVEGEIINKLHETGFSYDCILLNAGGYTHTSVAIADAISTINSDVIEIHISNIYSREEYRKRSLLSAKCKAVICGFGLDSYRLALESL